MSKVYAAGKRTSLTRATTGMGKSTPSTAPKVTASAGKSSGTARKGQPGGAPAMSKGK